MIFLILLLFLLPVIFWFALVLTPLLFLLIFLSTPLVFILCKIYQPSCSEARSISILIMDDYSPSLGVLVEVLVVVISRGEENLVILGNSTSELNGIDHLVETGAIVYDFKLSSTLSKAAPSLKRRADLKGIYVDLGNVAV